MVFRVHMLFDSQPGEAWGAEKRHNRLFFIGRELDHDYLQKHSNFAEHKNEQDWVEVFVVLADLKESPVAMDWSSNGRWVAVMNVKSYVFLVDSVSGRSLPAWQAHEDGLRLHGIRTCNVCYELRRYRKVLETMTKQLAKKQSFSFKKTLAVSGT